MAEKVWDKIRSPSTSLPRVTENEKVNQSALSATYIMAVWKVQHSWRTGGGIGDSRHGGNKRPAGYPFDLYVPENFNGINSGSYAGGNIVAGINVQIEWFHITGETSILETFGIK